jgi:hypothetical protein
MNSVAKKEKRHFCEKVMPRFVILEHDHPTLHWDLMLEVGDVLQTWRLAEAPAPGAIIEAIALGDHRKAYLDYEGPVSGGRGSVVRWDAGSFAEEQDSMAMKRLLFLEGTQIRSRIALQRIHGDEWRFEWLAE